MLYYKDKEVEIYLGNCLEVLKTFDENSIDACVTDPPYGISFMEKEWDDDIAFKVEVWSEIFRVLKPGAFLLAFSGSRTYHRVATAIEKAGFVIYPMLAWVYGSGFPKATDLARELDKKSGVESEVVGYEVRYNEATGIVNIGQGERKLTVRKITKPASEIGKKWNGWKYGFQVLRPSLEPICMAQKPAEGSVPDNIIKWKVGAVNIEGCKFKNGKWPTNVLHDGSYEAKKYLEKHGYFPSLSDTRRLIYCPKPSREEKERGLENLEEKFFGFSGGARKAIEKGKDKYMEKGFNKVRKVKNTHPTVKPVKLMEYLVKLVTPEGGTVIDPFMGSGTTLMACVNLGFKAIGIEIVEEYCQIAVLRIKNALKLLKFIENLS